LHFGDAQQRVDRVPAASPASLAGIDLPKQFFIPDFNVARNVVRAHGEEGVDLLRIGGRCGVEEFR
jgi:hypothetical protein